MTNAQERIIVFGTGALATAYCDKAPDDVTIVAFADNAVTRQGTLFRGCPVISAAQILSTPHDAILIASCFRGEIESQLVEQFGVPPDRIRRCPKGLGNPYKSLHPFAHDGTRRLGERVVLMLAEVLERHGIRYFVDHGTLLGLVRDGGLMPWDDDIDISVHEDDQEKVLLVLAEIGARLPAPDKVDWYGHFTCQRRGKLLGVTFVFDPLPGSDLKSVPAALWFVSFTNGLAEQFINLAPERHFTSADRLEFCGTAVSVPADCERYLEYHYGEWRVPVKDVRLSQITNVRKHEIAVEKIPFRFEEYRGLIDRPPMERIDELRGRFRQQVARGDVVAAYRQPWMDLPEDVLGGASLAVVCTSTCNLRCAECRNRIPFLPAGMTADFADPDWIARDLRSLADLIHVANARLDGGEPFLHPALDRVITAVAQSGIATRVHVGTNGTLPVSAAVIRACRDADAIIDIEDYGLDEQARLVPTLMRACDDAGVQYRLHQFGRIEDEWWMMGDPAASSEDSTESVHERFRRCRYNARWALVDGRFYKCSVAPFRALACGRGLESADGVAVRSAGGLDARRDRIRDYLTKTSFLETCRSCRGCASGRTMAGAQLDRETAAAGPGAGAPARRGRLLLSPGVPRHV